MAPWKGSTDVLSGLHHGFEVSAPYQLGDVNRDGLTVTDEHGVRHASTHVTPRRPFGTGSFVLARCSYFEWLDDMSLGEMVLDYPVQRWPIDQEVPGVITCLMCLGR